MLLCVDWQLQLCTLLQLLLHTLLQLLVGASLFSTSRHTDGRDIISPIECALRASSQIEGSAICILYERVVPAAHVRQDLIALLMFGSTTPTKLSEKPSLDAQAA